MEDEYLTSLIRLSAALLAGALIGLERTYHGRPAGFRTHILVSTSSSLLMMLTVFQERIIPDAASDVVRVDPTRMAQGIMTGIGFLGAGAILKESLTIRGLTTAGSIWMTAAVGIMIGSGLYFAAAVAVVIALGSLSLFRWFEAKVPSLHYAKVELRQPRDAVISEDDINRIFASRSISCTGTSYHLDDGVFSYEFTVRTRDGGNFGRLAETFRGMEQVSFSIIRSGD